MHSDSEAFPDWVVAGFCQTKIFYLFGSTEPPAAESR
jgi:hypothetical protein